MMVLYVAIDNSEYNAATAITTLSRGGGCGTTVAIARGFRARVIAARAAVAATAAARISSVAARAARERERERESRAPP